MIHFVIYYILIENIQKNVCAIHKYNPNNNNTNYNLFFLLLNNTYVYFIIKKVATIQIFYNTKLFYTYIQLDR